MDIKSKYKLLFIMLSSSIMTFAHIGPNKKSNGNGSSIKTKAASCTPATGRTFLEYNNVRTVIETSGYAFEDRSTGLGSYEVPKDGGRIVIYAGSLWMAGQTDGLVLKAAAHLYHRDDDFWAGPLTINPDSQGGYNDAIQGFGPGEITPEECDFYDRFWETTRQEAQDHLTYYSAPCNAGTGDCPENLSGYEIPEAFTTWPAHGSTAKFQDYYLAPFYDANGDEEYNAEDGDYPGYDLFKNEACPKPRGGKVNLFGDYNLWYVFNDKGNVHTESGGQSIGMEIKAQAFAFATSDEINSMTFYNYELINRSTTSLNDTYFGQYVDADIGCSGDDYAGCDVQRGFGYVYGGTAVDGSECFGAVPWSDGISPAIGVDFFEGPYQDDDYLRADGTMTFKQSEAALGADDLGFDNPLTEDLQVAIDSLGIPYAGLGLGYGDGVGNNERMGMSRFVYFQRQGSGYDNDPSQAVEFYNYMRGIWADGTDFLYGGTGHSSDPSATTIKANYIFPGDSDPLNWGTLGEDPGLGVDWTEQSAGNTVGDRRFVQAAGPFTLEPGALNNITVGVVYARANGGDPFESVELVRLADDKAQKLFDNCFRLIDGPNAPDVEINELDKQLVITISDCAIEPIETYIEKDPNISLDQARIDEWKAKQIAGNPGVDPNTFTGICDSCYYKDDNFYKFQGYQVFQLSESSVGPEDLEDISKARLVAQCDIKDGVSRMINYNFNDDLGAPVPVEMVDGSDEGIQHSFAFKEDAFAQGDVALVNYKKYHYMVVSYAYNGYRDYNLSDPLFLDGQQQPYLRGRKACSGSIQSYTGIPHKATAGTVVNSSYGDTPLIVREEGKGNGGLEVEITTESEEEILSNSVVKNLKYRKGFAPVDVKVIDPLKVPNDDFELRFVRPTDPLKDKLLYSEWELERFFINGKEDPNDDGIVKSDTSISYKNEQIIEKWGLSVSIDQPNISTNNILTIDEFPVIISSSIIASDSTKLWLGGIPDQDGSPYFNWIRSGTVEPGGDIADCNPANPEVGDIGVVEDNASGALDPNEEFEQVLGGTFSPFALVSAGSCYAEPLSAAGITPRSAANLKDVSSIDIVLTSDKSKWSRSPVIEMQNESVLAIGSAQKMTLRKSPSVDKDGKPDGTGEGMGWFPGYAIDLNTGERLNIAFGEDSWLGGHNGQDMLWNPTSTLFQGVGEPIFGGKHYVYIFGNNKANFGDVPAYDEGRYLESALSGSGFNSAWQACMWVGMPILNEGQELLSTDVRVKIRVSSEYERYSYDLSNNQSVGNTDNSRNDWYPLYTFNTGDIAPEFNDSVAVAALDSINIVPNPYYAYSEYEESRLENKVKLVNLPKTCTIKIFNSGGQLIRTFTKDNDVTFVDWDLTNHASVPISSGMYIIHIDVTKDGVKIGERVLKFMSIMRVPDLENS